MFAADHVGHGRSDGERVLIGDFEPVVEDLHLVIRYAAARHPGLPVVLIGHSTGGLIAARCTQLHAGALAATILSGPVLGSWAIVDQLLELEEIPSTPIDSATLSRDSAVGADDAVDPLVWHGDFVRPVPLPASWEGLRTLRGPATHTKACPGARHEIFDETNREEVLADVVDVVDQVLADGR